MVFAVMACGGGDPPELDRAAKVVGYLSAKRQVKHSSFLAQYPEGKPSQFVTWMFSPLGKAEWPDTEEYVKGDPVAREAAKALRIPLMPAGVAFVAGAPDPGKGKQLVVKSDDARATIVVEGYTTPGDKPVFRREWRFAKPAPR